MIRCALFYLTQPWKKLSETWNGRIKLSRMNSKSINDLRFADDITLVSESMRELIGMIREPNEKRKKAGLTINFEKFKIITTSPN